MVSGKVNFVRYQDNQPDQFYYSYNYDADNRLTGAWSGTEAMVNPLIGSSLLSSKKKDAGYSYYLHGPLARMVLGDGVQGIDYAYTLQGWLKGVNSIPGTAAADMGQDGADLTHTVARDVYGYSLGYYTNDYTPIGGSGYNAFVLKYTQTTGDITGQSLYNGNISNSTLAISQFSSGAPVGYTYHYDQLNRLKKTRQHTGISGTSWGRSITLDYQENATYDGNGNILTYGRNGAAPTAQTIDSLTYNYSKGSNGKITSNKLNYIKDAISNSNYTGDLVNQTNVNNYTYDPIGNLTKDVQAGITAISWSAYGKIQTISKATGDISYTYNPAGQRVSKTAGGLTTYYIREAQGNTLALYDNAHSTINWKKQQLYGSSRLGMWQPNADLTANNAIAIWDTVGHKQFEATNHLGTVIETMSDKRVQHSTNGTSIDYYTADIITAQDYYPGGMLQPGRQYAAGNVYPYGFNGKENDNEVKGVGNEQDYGMRIYDGRVGRFLSVDPITKQYPELTPYQFASNTPIQAVDRDGLEAAAINFPSGVSSQDRDDAIRGMNHAMAKYGTLPALVVVDAAFTKGWLTRLYIGSEFFSAFPHNQAKTPEGRAAQNKESWNHLVNAGLMWGSGKILENVFSLVSEIPVVKNIQAKFVNSNEVNAAFNKKGWYSPYKNDVTLAELNLTEDVSGLVRLSGPNNVKGDWFTTMNEIRGLSPTQLKDKFALKYAPTNMTPVSLNGPVRVGEAAKVPEFGQGGGFQIEALPGSQVNYGKTVPLQ